MLDLWKADCATIGARVCAVYVFLAEPRDEAFSVESVVAMGSYDGLFVGVPAFVANGACFFVRG